MGADPSRPLYLLPFDQRRSFVREMFRQKPPLTADQTATVIDAKRVIYDGFRQALSDGALVPSAGVLVDEEFGYGILRDDTKYALMDYGVHGGVHGHCGCAMPVRTDCYDQPCCFRCGLRPLCFLQRVHRMLDCLLPCRRLRTVASPSLTGMTSGSWPWPA